MDFEKAPSIPKNLKEQYKLYGQIKARSEEMKDLKERIFTLGIQPKATQRKGDLRTKHCQDKDILKAREERMAMIHELLKQT